MNVRIALQAQAEGCQPVIIELSEEQEKAVRAVLGINFVGEDRITRYSDKSVAVLREVIERVYGTPSQG